MSKNGRFLQFAGLLGFIFILFTFLVHLDLFSQFDFDSTVRLQNNISTNLNTALSALSLIGSVEIVSIFLLLILYVFKKLNKYIVLLIFAIMHIPELFAKAFVDHPGPPFMFFRYDINFSFPSSHVSPGSSYPSGHAARAIFISVILAYLISKLKLNKNSKYLAYGLIFTFDAIMLVSRVYLGEHWTSDVIGGSLLGAFFGVLSLLFFL